MGFWKELGKVLVKSSITFGIITFAKTQLNKKIENQIVNNIIKMIIFFIALLIKRFSLFGQNMSLFISSLIIVALLFHSAICLIPKIAGLVKTLINYKIIPLIPIIINRTSPSEIVAYYVFSWGPMAWDIKNKFDRTVGEWLPTADDLFESVWKYVGKKALIFVVTLVVYFVLFNLIVKPLLLISMIGITGTKVYILPFSMAIDFIFKTGITQLIID